MKPVVTWILIANARHASVMANHGPGKGLVKVGKSRTATDPATPQDKAGVGHSIGGHGLSAVEHADLQKRAVEIFAQELAEHLSKALAAGQFDRLILAAGPQMLGVLRAEIDQGTQSVLLGSIDKDLSDQPLERVTAYVDGFFAT